MRARWWWGIALIPVAAGLVVASLLADVGTLQNPIIAVRVDLGTLAFMGGLALSALAVGWRCTAIDGRGLCGRTLEE